MTTTNNVRRTGSHEETIEATTEDLFPLACPVAEYKWVDGWDFEMVYSESGVVEKHCIFRERMTGAFLLSDPDLETTWVVSDNDRDARWLRALLVLGDRAAGMFEVDGQERGDGSTKVTWNYTVTGLNEDGNQALSALEPTKIDLMLGFLGKSLKHYSETGKKLPAGDAIGQAMERTQPA